MEDLDPYYKMIMIDPDDSTRADHAKQAVHYMKLFAVMDGLDAKNAEPMTSPTTIDTAVMRADVTGQSPCFASSALEPERMRDGYYVVPRTMLT